MPSITFRYYPTDGNMFSPEAFDKFVGTVISATGASGGFGVVSDIEVNENGAYALITVQFERAERIDEG